jgi:hypothetical protein
MAIRPILLAAALLLAAGAARAADVEGPSVVPYRPSVSTPAQLSAPGWLELEAGALRAVGPDSGSSRLTVPWTLKLAFTPDWGIRVGGDAWVRQADPGSTVTGGGDTSVVAKRRFALDDASAWGLELGEKFPSAGSTLGSGRADTTLNGIYSSDFAPGWHADLNLNETRAGVPASRAHAWQTGWAAAVSRALDERWGVVGELSGTHQAAAPDSAQLLVAASWNASPAAVLDFGVAHGLSDVAPRNQVFAGMTVLLGKLF